MHNLWIACLKDVFKKAGLYPGRLKTFFMGVQTHYLSTVYKTFIPNLYHPQKKVFNLLKIVLHILHRPYYIKNNLNNLLIVINYRTQKITQFMVLYSNKLLILKG